MKYAVLALVLLMAGCTLFVDPEYDPAFAIPATGATTPRGICYWVMSRVAYLGDEIHDRSDYWQSPDQTYEWGRGDCEDYAILVMYLMHRDLGGWPEMAAGYLSDMGHAWVLYEGRQYEPQTGVDVTERQEYDLVYTIPYGKVMWRSMNTHRSEK